ncbi:hypothetical protein EIB18_12145 [Caulobacter vibrioides]|uniref:Uncharacterized protein n=1 Tax=Caulobacter vibrioides (strain NA1000 / CB15N) TaxID=565050 RepID=A0A0H3C9N1_CAUVN|nr:hypothetical protein [Caulobacter vibrioides]YP_002517749.1 hypothetical protein CCNA_02376 [Caulobacter vibrioides NA1000]ACL95841.1 hypothetical protein CCNA_02376 [Caulobacter vibrioides NA1000]ATC29154.1 hypothetical protein CA607_12445 [Caulobacter vibrioides]AZH13387.1 hypothetical protein EIB18_12145 [Caulobacter vibrioides]QXZ50665.1 hypothetical protein KZH45_12205 [Caulobacter vibrioides]
MTAQGRPRSRVAAATALRNNPAVKKCAWERAESRLGAIYGTTDFDARSAASELQGQRTQLRALSAGSLYLHRQRPGVGRTVIVVPVLTSERL